MVGSQITGCKDTNLEETHDECGVEILLDVKLRATSRQSDEQVAEYL